VQRVDPKSNGYVYIKDLRKLQKFGYSIDEITMVDDSPEKLVRQPRNHVHIAPFTGAKDDQSLLDLADKLIAVLR
jgi:RNA polymerase II subunit A small phosphatase-like protein